MKGRSLKKIWIFLYRRHQNHKVLPLKNLPGKLSYEDRLYFGQECIPLSIRWTLKREKKKREGGHMMSLILSWEKHFL